MKILFDTNVILDVLLDRAPFSDDASELFSAVEKKEIQGFIAATTVTTIFYLVSKASGQTAAKQVLQPLLELFDIAPIDMRVLTLAMHTQFSDFEDAVLYQAGVQTGVSGLVTRNVKDFKKANLPIYTPGELLKILS